MRTICIMNVIISILLLLPSLQCVPVDLDNTILDLLRGSQEDQVRGAKAYLEKYGYPHGSSSTDENETDESDMEKGLKLFQEMEEIPVTGQVDETTVETMEIPRCGNPDIVKLRSKRFFVNNRGWGKTNINYEFFSYPRVFRADFTETIRSAFKLWSDVTPLVFKEIRSRNAEIKIHFKPIDGHRGTVAETKLPPNGTIVFDIDENWSIGSYQGTNLLIVAAHEIGHAIGIDHSLVKDAVMHALYYGYRPNLALTTDDIRAAQLLYGTPVIQDEPTPPTDVTHHPIDSITTTEYVTTDEIRPMPGVTTPQDHFSVGLCSNAAIDTITMTENGYTYAFKGDWYYRMEPNRQSFNFSNPRPIMLWANDLRVGPIDAALTLTSGETVLFKGNHYWIFHNLRLIKGPLEIVPTSNGLEGNIDAAFVLGELGYVIKGDKVCELKIDLQVSGNNISSTPIYPRNCWNVSYFGFSGVKIDAALYDRILKTHYFFSGENYYRYNERSLKVGVGISNEVV